MAHIWQGFRSGLRSGEWLTAARMRAYSLILLGLSPWCRRMDRSLRRADRPRRPADRHRFFQRLCGRYTDLAGPLGGGVRPRAPACGGEGGVRRPRGAVLWLALSAVLLCDRRPRCRRSLRVGLSDLAGRELCGLPRRDPRPSSPRKRCWPQPPSRQCSSMSATATMAFLDWSAARRRAASGSIAGHGLRAC